MEWSTACPDWRERIVAGKSLMPCPPLFQSEADKALEYFNDLMVVDVAGSPAFGEIARPWITEFVAAIFGASDPETGRRLIKEFFLLISKKNGKSTLAAGIMVTALLLNWRKSAEFIILAPTLKVANNSAKAAMDMVSNDPDLGLYLKAIPHERKIVHQTTGATLTVVAADSNTVSGIKATGVLIDELWLFGKKSRAEEMLREATGGLMSRPEGFVIALSTQSDEPPTGVFKDWLDRFRKIRDGEIVSNRSLGLLYEFPEEMIHSEDYQRPENFYITNPNMGASVDEPTLMDEFEKERLKGKKSLIGFFAKHLNVEPGIGGRSDSWAGVDHWKRGAEKALVLDDLIARSEVIIVGIDGGGQDDLYGLTVLGREESEVVVHAAADPDEIESPVHGKRLIKRWLSWSHAWAHNSVLERRRSIVSKLRELEAVGDVTILEDGELDESGWPAEIAQVLAIIARVQASGLLCCVACDPWRIGELVDALAGIGVTQENTSLGRDYVTGVSQGLALASSAGTTVERKLANGTFIHADQPLMDWCVANIKVERLPTGFRFTKQNAGDAKIDPAMALFNAAMIMATNPEACRSAYEDQGILFV